MSKYIQTCTGVLKHNQAIGYNICHRAYLTASVFILLILPPENTVKLCLTLLNSFNFVISFYKPVSRQKWRRSSKQSTICPQTPFLDFTMSWLKLNPSIQPKAFQKHYSHHKFSHHMLLYSLSPS